MILRGASEGARDLSERELNGAKPIIAMIHVGALPGTPRQRAPLPAVIERAVAEALLYAGAGVDQLLIENMHDTPYLSAAVGPEIVAGMTAVGAAVRAAAALPLGVQILAGANREALAVALAVGAEFVRVENFVFAHVADEGLMPTAEAGMLLRYRRQIGAEHVRIIADIKKKHASHALTADISIAETASAAAFFGADGLIVTGRATGEPVDGGELRAVRGAAALPIFIGSGITAENLATYWALADGFIVGSALKRDGVWSNPIDPARLGRCMAAAATLRATGA